MRRIYVIIFRVSSSTRLTWTMGRGSLWSSKKGMSQVFYLIKFKKSVFNYMGLGSLLSPRVLLTCLGCCRRTRRCWTVELCLGCGCMGG